MQETFHLTDDIPLPPELSRSLEFTHATPADQLRSFWNVQLEALSSLVESVSPIQAAWDSMIPAKIRSAAGFLKTTALSALMRQFSIGGQNWIPQFIYGFDIIGNFSQRGVFPCAKKIPQPADPDTIWSDVEERFCSRAKSSGYAQGGHLWAESLDQVDSGWLSAPQLLTPAGQFTNEPDARINAAFRFPVSQLGKTRACDDLKYGRVNPCASDATPTKLPTWDHISQMCLGVSDSAAPWSFFKADRESAYKNLPLKPDQAPLCVVTLRSPGDGLWYGFAPKTLLSGASAAVRHYNCFSRIIAVLINLIFGLPTINYFDDFGCLPPTSLVDEGLALFTRFCALLGIRLKAKKTEVGRDVTFLGLRGSFPGPDTDMSLRIDLPALKKRK